jgi:DNA polymerase-3 subunit alpha
MHEVFVERKHGRQKITYRHPDLEPILRDTYGVILYQEQVMQLASVLGGFSMGQADTLRKAMGKKKADMMRDMKARFMSGAAERGYDEKVAREVFEEMEFFAQYGFNKSHSAAYALLSLQTAWLKAHHPAEFMAATMTSEMRKSERITQLIDECKVMGLKIQPPDINRPRAEFSVAEGEIIFGLGAVRGVGTTAIDAVKAVGRPLTDLFDLCGHADLQKVNRKVLEGLIHAGALDRLPGDRATLVANLERAIAWGQMATREREGGQESLFGGAAQASALKPPLIPAEPFDPLVQLSLEREAVGFYLCGHPFQEYGELVDALPVTTVCDAATRGEGTRVDLVGVITSHTKARDKHKRVYARAHFEDRTAMISVVVYARLYEEARELVECDAVQVISGRVQVRSDGEREIVVERMTHIDQVLATWTRYALLKMDLGAMGAVGLARLEQILDEHRGTVPLLVDTSCNGRNWLLRASGRSLDLSLASLRALRAVPGLETVRLRVAVPPLLRTVS